MRATTAVLVDDESVLRGELKEMLAVQWPGLDVVTHEHVNQLRESEGD